MDKGGYFMYLDFTPMLLVDDVDEALKWYSEILGANLQYSLPENPPFEWISILLNDVEIMIAKKESAKKWYSHKVSISDSPANFIAYIYVEDINGLYVLVKEKVKIIMEPKNQTYGIREFAVKDPFGFILIFAQIKD